MSDLIRRKDVLEYLERRIQLLDQPGDYMLRIECEIIRDYVEDDVPAVDAAPVVHARWERCEEDWRHQIEGNECSACGFVLYGPVGHYCPRCGAKMDGGAKDGEG